MKDNKNRNLENLTEEQLKIVNSILSRPQLETEALVEVVKINERKPVKDMEARKKQILDNKLREKEQKIMEAKTNNMLSGFDKWADIDSQLAQMEKQKKLEDEKRAKQVEQIMQEMQRKRRAIETYERNKFRARYTAASAADRAKANSFLAQKERADLDEEKQRHDKIVQNAINAVKEAQGRNVFSPDTTIVKDTAVAPETVTLGNQSNLPKQTNLPKQANTRNLNPNISRPFITRVYDKAVDLYQAMKSKYNNFIANGRVKQENQVSKYDATQAYEKTMSNQSQSTFNATSGNSSKADRLRYTGTLQFKVNEKKALEKANSQAEPRYEPRTV